MARWVNLDDCIEISAGEMRFYPVELLGDVYEDVVPVVHAHWIESYWGATGAECSNCHGVIPTYDMDYQEVKHDFEYCPYCGAKMDEEVNDG